MDLEDGPRAHDWIESTCEIGFDARALVVERCRQAPAGDPLPLGPRLEANRVSLGLSDDAAEHHSRRLCLQHPDRLLVCVQEVIHLAVIGAELPHGDAAARGQVDLAIILHRPTRLPQLLVDVPPRALLGREVVVDVRHLAPGNSVTVVAQPGRGVPQGTRAWMAGASSIRTYSIDTPRAAKLACTVLSLCGSPIEELEKRFHEVSHRWNVIRSYVEASLVRACVADLAKTRGEVG